MLRFLANACLPQRFRLAKPHLKPLNVSWEQGWAGFCIFCLSRRVARLLGSWLWGDGRLGAESLDLSCWCEAGGEMEMGKALKMGPVACTWWREEPVAAGKALLGGESLWLWE